MSNDQQPTHEYPTCSTVDKSGVRIVEIGSPDWEPTEEDLQRIRDLFMQADLEVV